MLWPLGETVNIFLKDALTTLSLRNSDDKNAGEKAYRF